MAMFAHTDHVDDASEHATDEAYDGPAHYVVDMNGLVAGPFDTADEGDWWIAKSLRMP
jgi:hypothetical protein